MQIIDTSSYYSNSIMWTNKAIKSTNGVNNIQQGNKEYVAAFTQGHLALPPSQKYLVST
jgi:carbonic anhydrase